MRPLGLGGPTLGSIMSADEYKLLRGPPRHITEIATVSTHSGFSASATPKFSKFICFTGNDNIIMSVCKELKIKQTSNKHNTTNVLLL